ncbi:MAG: A/G-specific adenine glycosylase [Dehalococcoidia bacterium]|nr:A/G-specific adenine glycosylase [Dehalococcoidia bacterium]
MEDAVREAMAELGEWYRERGRHELPWRGTRDPYAVFLSEVMLQQTQVERVRPYWERWMARWPSPAALAGSPLAEAIREWAGLGYNRRALHLHRAAVAVVERHDGAFPANEAAVRALPGAGEYTAAAVACFAGEVRTFVADTNIARVLARATVGVAAHRGLSRGALRTAGEALLPDADARSHNLALMDLGALVCTPRTPACDACPLARTCAWKAAGYPGAPPPAKPATPFETTARFARGRIVDALRRGPRLEAELRGALPPEHASRVEEYLAALARDGLVARAGEGWALPG